MRSGSASRRPERTTARSSLRARPCGCATWQKISRRNQYVGEEVPVQDVGTLLAIDTSGATASVAVYHDQVLAESTWQSGRGHSSQLIPMIEAMLNLAHVDRKGLSAVAVATGPGSYAGLRVGVS